MVSTSSIEILASRFAPYIDELQDFFRSRGLPFGEPADLALLADRLADPAFAEEMVSMTRSILYREDGMLPSSELMELVAIAAGGPHIDEPAYALHEPLRTLLDFSGAVVRSQRASVPLELPETEQVQDEPEPPQAADVAVPYLDRISRPVAPEPERATTATVPVPPHTPDGATHLTSDKFSQALFHARPDELKAEPETEPASPPHPAHAPTASPEDRRLPPLATTPRSAAAPSARGLVSVLRRSYWIPGLCVLLLAIAVAWTLNNKTAPPHATPASVPAPILMDQPKPSPGTPIAAAGHRNSRDASEPSTLAKAGPEDLAPAAPDAALPSTAAADRRTPESARNSHADRFRADRTIAIPSSTHFPGSREGVFLASSGVMAGHLLFAPSPGYPKLATLTRVEGEVILQVVVGRDGGVAATRVLEGSHLLRAAAEHAVRRWRYRPYVVDGKATDVATIVTVNFRLRH